jgi:hypothetical protein
MLNKVFVKNYIWHKLFAVGQLGKVRVKSSELKESSLTLTLPSCPTANNLCQI